jgi:glycerophosphoryl diester phosphodiesterase
MDAFEIIAHRGASFLAPENTRAAVELGWQEAADAAEGDFRLTADGKIVAMHDAGLRRTAGVDRRVAECALDELRSYEVGSWKSPKYAGEPIPTLDELLATVPPGKRFYVEVKCGVEIIDELCRVVERSSLKPEQIIMIGLQFETIAAIKQAIPQCPAYWVVEFKRDSADGWQPTPAAVLQKAQCVKLDGLDLMATGPIDATFSEQIRAAGLGLCVWTVDDPASARQLINLGVQGITTNRPGWLREQLRG